MDIKSNYLRRNGTDRWDYLTCFKKSAIEMICIRVRQTLIHNDLTCTLQANFRNAETIILFTDSIPVSINYTSTLISETAAK